VVSQKKHSLVGCVHAYALGLGVGLVYVLIAGLNDMIFEEPAKYSQIKKPYQRFHSSMRQLYFSILQHWHLRYLLYKKGLLPWHLVDFLNEMVTRKILETDGAIWRFRHRILQEYFAVRWEEPPPE
jgi:hypothetical protein